MILTNSYGSGPPYAPFLLGLCDLLPTPSLFTLPARLPGATPQKKGRRDLTLYWTGAYILQMIIYAICGPPANTVSWTVAMMFRAVFPHLFWWAPSFTDFDRPAKQPPAPPPDGTAPEIKKRPPAETARRTFYLTGPFPRPIGQNNAEEGEAMMAENSR